MLEMLNSRRTMILAGLMITMAAPAAGQSSPGNDMVAQINQYRTKGTTCARTGRYYPPVRPLRLNARLSQAASDWSQRMARSGSLAHGDPRSRIRAACPNPGLVGENIAYNPSASGAVRRWMTGSKGHCETIMTPSFAQAGVGYARGGFFGTGGYWTIDFASRC
ncbi:CAP domain-containing protein [Fulvimarina sp. MAC8]|uniref:CAP domain-containing protein n=1 Tax=Fulvimarina sp. MAC8 TaxID=3162874 RepID=UPI0032ED2705